MVTSQIWKWWGFPLQAYTERNQLAVEISTSHGIIEYWNDFIEYWNDFIEYWTSLQYSSLDNSNAAPDKNCKLLLF